jgi:hypothetical protein
MRKALQACSDPHLVSFVFTCEIDPEIMAKRMELDKVEDEKRMRGRKMKLEELHQRKQQMCKQETERSGNSDDDASNSDDDNQVPDDPHEMDDFIVQDDDAESDSGGGGGGDGGGEEPDACAPSSRKVGRKKEDSRNKKLQKGKKMIEILDSDSDDTDSDLSKIDAGLKQCKKAKKIPTKKVVANQTESSDFEDEDLGIAEEDETQRVIRELQEEGWGTRRSTRDRRNTARFVDGRENNPNKKSPKRQKVGDNSDKGDITTNSQKVSKHKTRFPQDSRISSSHQMEDNNVEVEPKKKGKGRLSLKKNRDSNAPSTWKCPLCTFLNPWKKKTCKVCYEGTRAVSSQAGSEDTNSTSSGEQALQNSTEQIEESAVTATDSIVESFDSRATCDDDKTDDGDDDLGTSIFNK